MYKICSRKEVGDRIFIDNYNLSAGLYIRILESGDIDEDNIMLIKNKKDMDNSNDTCRWFSKRDFYSSITSANKFLSPSKKFQSSNYYTLYFIRETLPDMNKEFYNQLNQLKLSFYKKVNKDRKLMDEIDNSFSIFENDINDIVNICNSSQEKVDDKVKIKLFIDKEVNEIKEASETCFFKTSSIFADITNITEKDGVTYGIPDFAINLNNKKPLLKMENMPFKSQQYLVSIDYAYFIWKLQRLLSSKIDKYTLWELMEEIYPDYKPDKDIYMKFDIGKSGLKPYSYEVLPKHFEDNKDIDFTIFKIAGLKDTDDINVDGEKKKVGKSYIGSCINNIFSNKGFFIIINQKSMKDAAKVKGVPGNVIKYIYIYKEDFIDYLYKKKDINLFRQIDKITAEAIKDKLFNTEIDDNKEVFSLRSMIDWRISLLNYFDNKERGIGKMAECIYDANKKIKEKIKKEEYEIEDDTEFYYIIGQIVYYLLSRSKSSHKTGRLVEPFYNAYSEPLLKERIVRLYRKYSYEILLKNNTNFSKLFSAVMSYVPLSTMKDKNNKNIFLCGLFKNDNIMYQKTNNESEEN